MNWINKLFSNKQSINIYQNNVSPPVTFKQLSFEQLESLYDSLPDIRIIEDWISDNIAKIPVGVYSRRDKELFNTPLNQLIDQTNPTQGWTEYIKEVFILYGLTGNTITYRDPKSGYLYTLATSDTFVQLGKDKTIPEFLNYISGYRYQIGGKDYFLEETNVLHVKGATLSSEDGLWCYGSSPYFAGTPNINTLEANYSSRVSTIRDRGAMGVLSNESEYPDEKQTKLVTDLLKTDYGLREDQKKIIATTQKLTYQQIALGIAEMQLIENLDHDFDTMCELRGLDPVLFTSKETTFNNQNSARGKAINNVIVPLADKFYNKLNEFLSSYYPGLRIMPKYDELPEYGSINMDLTKKLISEVKSKIITAEQAFEQLYPDGEFVEIKEPEPIEQIPIKNESIKDE